MADEPVRRLRLSTSLGLDLKGLSEGLELVSRRLGCRAELVFSFDGRPTTLVLAPPDDPGHPFLRLSVADGEAELEIDWQDLLSAGQLAALRKLLRG